MQILPSLLPNGLPEHAPSFTPFSARRGGTIAWHRHKLANVRMLCRMTRESTLKLCMRLTDKYIPRPCDFVVIDISNSSPFL
jgi:hypothetical protein